jgi:hypothetical protein
MMNWIDGHIVVDPPKKPLKITGTRFAAILGYNKWSTPFKCWCEITRTYKEPFVDTIYTAAGKVIEPKQAEYMKTSYAMYNLKTPTDIFGEDYFKKTWTAGHLMGLQGGGDSQAYGFFGSAFIRYNQIGGQRIQMTLNAFYAGIEALCINRHILPYLCCYVRRPPFSVYSESDTSVSTYHLATRLANAEYVHSKNSRFSSPRIITV